MLFAAPHFLKNWVYYENPFYPLAQRNFPNSTPRIPDAALFMDYLFADWRFHPPATLGERLKAALQMVSRAGVVSDAELIEFRSAAETLGAALGATLLAPEMREALDEARLLDRICADADIQVALHVTGGAPQAIEPAQNEFQIQQRADGLSLTLDVPRTLEPVRAFEAMARAGGQLAAAGGGRLVDDNGNLLDERALAAIGAELEGVRAQLAEAGFEPGSELALRLFS